MRIYRRKGSPHWWYDFSIRGRRFRGSCETDDRDIADQIASKLRTDELLGLTTGKRPSMTLDQVFGRWWLEVGQFHGSWKRSKGVSKALLKLLGKTTLLEHVDDGIVSQVIARRRGKVADSTVNREIAVLRSAHSTARRKWKAATADIDWSMHKLHEPDPVERYLTTFEADRLIAVSADHIKPMIACALYTGMRRGSVLKLDWSRVDLPGRRLTIFGKSRKPGGSKNSIPIAPPLLVVFANLGPRNRGPVFTYKHKIVGDIKTGFRAACRRAGLIRWKQDGGKGSIKTLRLAEGPCTPVRWVPIVRFHDLRHTAASWMVQEGVPIDVVQKILGHSDIKLTLRYAHRAPDARERAIEVLGRVWRGTKMAHAVGKKAKKA